MIKDEFYFKRRIQLLPGEHGLLCSFVEKTMDALKRNQKNDWMFSPVRSYQLLWGLSSYALFLREVVAGRVIRYQALVNLAVSMAAFMNHAKVLAILERNGVDVRGARWTRNRLNVVTMAVMTRSDELALSLLCRFPELVMDRETCEANLKVCVRFGSARLVREILCRLSDALNGKDGDRLASLLGVALFTSVATDRRKLIDLILKMGADGGRSVTDGCFPAHLSSSLLSCAVDNKNFKFADLCFARGWLPSEEEIWDLPNNANALCDLEKFKYLCEKFPEEDFRSDVLDDLVKHYEVSREVYAYCGGTGEPRMEDREEDAVLSDEEVLEKDSRIGNALRKCPDRIVDLVRQDGDRVRTFFATKPQDYWLPVYLFRLARSRGIELFSDHEAIVRYVESLPDFVYRDYVPFLEELGWPRKKNLPEEFKGTSRGKKLFYDRVAKATGKDLKKYLDDPSFDPNADVYPNWSFTLSVACSATPAVFKKWALRGMDVYATNCEGTTAIDLVELPKWKMLVEDFGMDVFHVADDGCSAFGNAIGSRSSTARWIWRHRGGRSWKGASPLRMALLDNNDELARWFFRQGVRNVDHKGIEHDIPSWIRTTRIRPS